MTWEVKCLKCGCMFDLDDENDSGRFFLEDGGKRIPLCGECTDDLVKDWVVRQMDME